MAALLCVLRVSSVLSFSEPVQNVTSGWEQESLFALWKRVNDIPVYNDSHKLPFSISFYNWLFYETYGPAIKVTLRAFSLSDAWLPTVARCVTFIGAILGAIISYFAFLEVAGHSTRVGEKTKLIAASFAGFTFFGPLVGFWVFTARTDIWTLLLEASAIFLFWRYYRSAPVRAVLLCALACYLAWSLKHISVFTASTVGLWLLGQRDWRRFLIFSTALGLAYGATLYGGSDEYFSSLFLTGELGFDPHLAVRNVSNFVLKSSPGLAALGVIVGGLVASRVFRAALLKDPGFQFALIGFGLSMVMMVPGSAKDGAAENYFFVPSLFMSLLAVVAITRFESIEELKVTPKAKSLFFGTLSLGWLANVAALLVVFSGIKGVISIEPFARYYEQGTACVKDLPQPFYVEEFYLSLPWINPSRPVVYPAYNYPYQRARGYEFERGGIGGMITAGHFKALVLTQKVGRFDGADLTGFRLAETCGGFHIYLQKSAEK